VWRFELIAVDDGSTDGTAALLRKLAQAKPWLQAVCLACNLTCFVLFDPLIPVRRPGGWEWMDAGG